MDKSKEILFELGDNTLYVANGGRPFERTGVIAICGSHLSDKQARQDGTTAADFYGNSCRMRKMR